MATPITLTPSSVGETVEWRNENGTLVGNYRGLTGHNNAYAVLVSEGRQVSAPAEQVYLIAPSASSAEAAVDSALQAAANLAALRAFLPRSQYLALAGFLRGAEKAFYQSKLAELKSIIAAMPETYGQEEKGDQAIAYLHYFLDSHDFYISEKDTRGVGTEQAFGLICMPPGYPETGYINIAEIVACGAELDLYWTPTTLALCEKKAVA